MSPNNGPTMKIGITSTIPVEVLFAAGAIPVDLNNLFISRKNAADMVQAAEYDGYPRNVCGWIKGIYATVLQEGIDTIIAVVEGDCSQTHAMVETLQTHGVRIIPFSYPFDRDPEMLRLQISRLIDKLGTSWDAAEKWKKRLDEIRRKVRKIDDLTWQTGKVTGFENHFFQISCSDFEGDPDAFENKVDGFIAEIAKRPKVENLPKIGLAGIPPIYTDFFETVELFGVQVAFNEVQRQFAMPYETENLVSQYTLYTYPYDIFGRIKDIKRETKRRGLCGIIHYTQSFCFRQIQDLILRKQIDVPILNIEGEYPVKVDARTKIRIESFIEMLQTWKT